MRLDAFLTGLLLAGSSAAAATVGSKYVLLDVPYTAAAVPAQTYTTTTGTKVDPWTFAHGLLTLMSSRAEYSDFRDARGRTLRVNTLDGQLRGLYPVVWNKVLSRAWSGTAWAYGGLNYACRIVGDRSVSFQFLPEQPLQVARVYRLHGTLPGVSHRNTFSAGILYSDEPVQVVNPLLVEFSAPGWKATGGSGPDYLGTQKLAPSVCRAGFLPLLDQGGLDRSLSRKPLPAGLYAKRWTQVRGAADVFFRGWTRNDIRTAFGSPDEAGTLAQLNTLERWTYQGPVAELYRFTFQNDRVVTTTERHMP